jgi:hypothetical protein
VTKNVVTEQSKHHRFQPQYYTKPLSKDPQRVSLQVRTYMYVYTYTHTYIQIFTCIHVYTSMYICTCICFHIQTLKHFNIYIYIYIQSRTPPARCLPPCRTGLMPSRVRKDSNRKKGSYLKRYTYIFIYIHFYIYICICR